MSLYRKPGTTPLLVATKIRNLELQYSAVYITRFDPKEVAAVRVGMYDYDKEDNVPSATRVWLKGNSQLFFTDTCRIEDLL